MLEWILSILKLVSQVDKLVFRQSKCFSLFINDDFEVRPINTRLFYQ